MTMLRLHALAAGTFVALLLGACAGRPLTRNSVWKPATPRDELVLNDPAKNPNVLSSLRVGTREPLLADPLASTGIELPNGTFLMTLNGVVDPPKLIVPRGTVVAPAAAVFVGPDRIEWYVHLDGSYTTSRWVWNRVLLRWEPSSFYVPPGGAVK